MKRFSFVNQFQCLGAECEDTCCKGWAMQTGDGYRSLLQNKAPELLSAVVESELGTIMRRDLKTDYCTKYEQGLCSIHRDYGEELLGDACHLFPRILRHFGDEQLQSCSLSCPEVVRLAVVQEGGFDIVEAETPSREPSSLTNYLPDHMEDSQAFEIVEAMLAMVANEERTAPRAASCLISMLHSLEKRKPEQWAMAVNMYSKMVDSLLPKPEQNQPIDAYYLLQTLRGLYFASGKTVTERFGAVFSAMEKACGVTIHAESLDIFQNVGEENAVAQLEERWAEKAAQQADPYLKRWVMAQIAMYSYPFSGFGNDLKQRAITFAVRFATVRLGLMAHMDEQGNAPDEATTVLVIQTISRFLDHLQDPELSMKFYEQAGWVKEARLRGLVGDVS